MLVNEIGLTPAPGRKASSVSSGQKERLTFERLLNGMGANVPGEQGQDGWGENPDAGTRQAYLPLLFLFLWVFGPELCLL